MKQIFIGARHGERFFYTAKPAEDGTSIVVQRVIIEDGQESYETLANFVDAGVYAMSFLATDDNSYEVTKRIPNENYFEYELNIPEKFKEHYVECITPYERPMRVRYGNYNEEEEIFTSFLVTLKMFGAERKEEYLVAVAEVNENNQMGVALHGAPVRWEWHRPNN